jgi:squalene/oxidosqualene cyclase-like protein
MMTFDFWTVVTFVSGTAVLLYVGWLVYNARQMRSPAYQKRFAKLSEADLARLVERMKIPLERGSDEFDVSKSQVSATGWRLEGVRGQQVWKHYADERLAPWPQTVWEKYHVGVPLSDSEAPRSAGKAGDSLTAALNGARFAAKLQVTSTGHWANDYGGPMFLLPGMVIVRHIVNAPFEQAQRLEIVRYLRGKQNGDGGWGLHIDSPSCIFGSVLSYVSLRILGVPAGDGACARGREFMNKNGGVLGAPDWAKFWLSTLGVYDYRGLRPLTPELWIMPRWVPFHPWRYWCHARMVYLPMSYCYGVRFVAAHTPLVDELRRELYGMYAGGYDAVDWPAHQFHTCPLDYFQPLSWLAKFAFSALWVYERMPALPGALLRARALKWIVELIDVEDESTNYIDIGPVNKCMNMVAIFHRYGADSPQLRKHLARTADYLWQAADGMKMQGYNGSQLWDTSFVCQAMSSLVRALPAPLPDADPIMLALRRGYGFFDIAQVRRDLELRDYYYRHPSNGAWPFSTEAHGWPISDCFPEHDHQILTNRGFLFLDEVEALVERDAAGAVVDWRGLCVATYDAASKQLVYAQPRRLVVNQHADDKLVEISQIHEAARWSSGQDVNDQLSNRISIICTKNHQLYVRRGEASGSSFGEKLDTASTNGSHFVKISAEDVLRQRSQERPVACVRFLCRAPNGVGLSSPTAIAAVGDMLMQRRSEFHGEAMAEAGAYDIRDDPICGSMVRALELPFAGAAPAALAPLELTAAQVRPFLALFGFWLGDGTMSGSHAITFSNVKVVDCRFIQWALDQCGLRRHADYVVYDANKKGETKFNIHKRSWFQWWYAEYDVKYDKNLREERSVKYGKGEKCMPAWMFSLPADLCRAVIYGVQLADGSAAMNTKVTIEPPNAKRTHGDEKAISTSWIGFRDDLVRLMLHAGYATTFSRHCKAGSARGRSKVCQNKSGETKGGKDIVAARDCWRVFYSDVAHTEPFIRAAAPSVANAANRNVLPADVVREVDYTGRTWCFDMNDGFVVVRRAHRVKASEYYAESAIGRNAGSGAWVVTQASRATIQGNCTSEGLKGVLACERLGSAGSADGDKVLSNRRLCDAIDILLTYQNADDGGFPTYELKRAGEWLELLNPAEVFARIMVDYSYVELTSACITAMVQFRKRNAECAAYRRADIDDSLRRALEFVKMRQRADGSWYGSWAVCFTYGGWFGIEALTHMGQGDSDEAARAVEFFISKQNADGGWGESWWSCLLGEYCAAASMPECTGWCLLSYAHAVDAGVCNARPELAKRLRASADRAAQCLIQLQLPNGDWKPGPTCGMFNGSVTISYNIYSKAFPIWALAEHARVFGTMK